MPKKKKLDKLKLTQNAEFARALIDSSSVNEESRSVDILISTESPIRRTDWWSGEQYDEILMHGTDNVDLTRAATAKLRWMHGSGKYGELPLGRLENVRIENSELRATAIFSEANPDAEMFWRMVLENTLTEISVGGKKQEVRITEREGEPALVEVTRWEFQEASLVDIGADPSAGIGRSENNNEGDIMNKLEKLQRQLDELKKGDDAAAIARKMDEIDEEIKLVAAENRDLKRRDGITALAAQHVGLMDEEGIKRFIDDKEKSVDDFTRALLAAKTEQQTDIHFQRGQDTDGKDAIMRAVGDSLLMRFGVAVAEPDQNAGNYTGASMLEIARAITGYDGFNRDELIERAMSTSDFPILLGNVANKMMASAFDEELATFEAWTAATDVKDFKQGTAAAMKAGGRLQKAAENGELKSIEFSEEGEVFKLESFGNEFRVTRQMLINDDLGAFGNIIAEFGQMARRTANGLAYDMLQGKGDFASYVMSDSKAIFHADHKNYDASGAAVSTSVLTAARTKVRRQTDSAGNKLHIVPKYLLVAPEQETSALQLMNSESDPSSSNSGVKNPHQNSMSVIVDSELDAAPWYLAAPRKTIKVLYLQGTGRKPIVREKSRDLSGVTFECVFDFGLYAEDFRGLYKNAGA